MTSETTVQMDLSRLLWSDEVLWASEKESHRFASFGPDAAFFGGRVATERMFRIAAETMFEDAAEIICDAVLGQHSADDIDLALEETRLDLAVVESYLNDFVEQKFLEAAAEGRTYISKAEIDSWRNQEYSNIINGRIIVPGSGYPHEPKVVYIDMEATK